MDVQPDRLSFDASGAPYSARYRDVYASRDGALGQARHVFLAGTGLPERWCGRRQFVVLETGFGLASTFSPPGSSGAAIRSGVNACISCRSNGTR
jgi:tRNA 5-methylaminomethyl-2-thiouridine biosynthesis bifunctional protein